MIGRLTGTIAQKRNPLIIDVGGVGYLVHVTEKFVSTIESGKKYTLAIHTHVREDMLDLYGFASENELVLFELLLTVSGIGPKTALLIMSRGVADIQRAVSQADVEFFTSIPRLGRKNAQKIIIELKNKLGNSHDLDLNAPQDSETKQIIEALISMGYHRQNIVDALTKIPEDNKTIEQKIKHVIKLL